MSNEFYRLVHLSGLILLFSGLAGLWGAHIGGGAPARPVRITLALLHGFGLLFLIVSGFGLLARLGFLSGLPGWAIAKIVIWLFLGGAITLLKRRFGWALPACLVAGALAAYLCIYKP